MSAKSSGVVTTVNGEVFIYRDGETRKTLLNFRDAVTNEDHIKTTNDGIVEILLDDATVLTVAESSEVKLDRDENARVGVEIIRGTASLSVSGKHLAPAEFVVTTPTKRTSISGGILIVEVQPVQTSSKLSSSILRFVALDQRGIKILPSGADERFHVQEGTAQIKTIGSDKSLVTLRAGQSVAIRGTTISEPGDDKSLKTPGVNLQLLPQHRTIPAEARQNLIGIQLQQVQLLQQALVGGTETQTASAAAETSTSDSSDKNDVVLPTTSVPLSTVSIGTNSATVDVILPPVNPPPLPGVTPGGATPGQNALSDVSIGPDPRRTPAEGCGTGSGEGGGGCPAIRALKQQPLAANNRTFFLTESAGCCIAQNLNRQAEPPFALLFLPSNRNAIENASVEGTLISIKDGSIVPAEFEYNVSFSRLVFIGEGSSLTSTSTASVIHPSLIDIENSSSTGQLLTLEGHLTINGSLLAVRGPAANARGFPLFDIRSTGSLTHAAVNVPLVSVDAGRIEGSIMSIAGTVQTEGPGLFVKNGGSINTSAQALFALSGSATQEQVVSLDDQYSLPLGSNRPLRGTAGGPLRHPLLISGEPDQTVTTSPDTLVTENLVRLDTALLEATSPLLSLNSGSQMTSTGDLMHLAQKAQMSAHLLPNDALIRLNASDLTVNSSLVNLAAGSFMSLQGHLVHLTNGSSLTINNGSLLNVNGGSVFSLTGGSLVAFGGMGTNRVTINNPSLFCANNCVPINGGYQVLLTGGATADHVKVATSFTPVVGATPNNTVTINNNSSGPIAVLDGAQSRMVLGQ